MKNRVYFIFIILFVIIIAGCTRNCQIQPENKPPGCGCSPVLNAEVQAAAPKVVEKGDVFIEPAGLEACGGGASNTVKVLWNVPGGSGTYQVEVVDGDGQRQLFAEGGASGEELTGPWVGPGSRFFLLKKETAEVLGSAVVESLPCAQ